MADTQQAPPVAVAYISGDIDIETADTMRYTITGMLTAGHTQLVADLSAVTFMDASGINALLAARHQAAAAGASLTLRAPSAAVLRLLAIPALNLARVLPVSGLRWCG